METLPPRRRATRVWVTLVGLAVLLVGTFWGQDDHFPFGPFRMYSTANPPNAPAPDTRVEGVDSTGALITLGPESTGIRRAEVEGQQARYAADPNLLRQVAQVYSQRHPGAPTLVEVRIVIRWHGITSGRPTGTFTDETVVSWRAG